MTGTVHTYTTIHTGLEGSSKPYAIAVVDVGCGRISARMEGDVSNLAVGVGVSLTYTPDGWRGRCID